jgi:Polysaccharide pyruvyl transferase
VKALVAGWFSFEQMGATAGDLLARDLVVEWLTDAGHDSDLAIAAPFTGGVHWATVDPETYDVVVFVCGPFGNGWPVTDFLRRFEGRRLVGIDLTMLEPLEEWNPFDLLIERDSNHAVNPDITFLAHPPTTPVIGVVRVHPQEEYGDRGRHRAVDEAIDRLLDGIDAARVPIDTRLDQNATGLRAPGEVESLIAKMDVVITTRLHGTVLSLKNGVPPLVIDPIAGGGKVLKQAATLGWPYVFTADSLDDNQLRTALATILKPEARADALACAARARDRAVQLRRRFIDNACCLA